jgi:hypothetical protein
MFCDIRWEAHGVFRKFYGAFRFQELLASVKTVGGDIRFADLQYSILDCLELQEDQDVPDAELELVAKHLLGESNSNPSILIAIVTTSEEACSVIQRFMALDISPYPLKIFSTVADARMWISQQGHQQDSHEWRPRQPR